MARSLTGFLSFLAVFCAFFPAAADVLPAHPAMWHIKGPHGGQATLLGSMHVLPANTAWVTPDISRALSRADIFVFEVATDAASRTALDALIDARGYLPDGQSLHALLPPAAQNDYEAAIAAAHLSADVIDREQPWLVSLQLTLASSMNRNYFPDAGVDYVLMSWANQRGRSVRYLETVDQQFQMLVPDNNELRLDAFEADLKHMEEEPTGLDPLLAAWCQGDEEKLGALMEGSFADQPEERKLLITDRNKRWAKQIEAMLDEDHNFFITVGAAHLAGADGVPALLRADGYQVDGP